MSLYESYLEEIEERKGMGLNPKPIDDESLANEIISQIDLLSSISSIVGDKFRSRDGQDLSNLILIFLHHINSIFSGFFNKTLESMTIYDLFIFFRNFTISYCCGYPNSSTEFNLFFFV